MCCCPKPEKSRGCVRGSWRTRHVVHNLRNGHCHTSVHEVHRPVTCPKWFRKTLAGPCHKGRQHYKLYYWVKHGCKCVSRVKSHYRKCTCQYKAVELVVAVDMYAKKELNDRNGYGSSVTKFLDTLLQQVKFGSAKVRTTVLTYSSAVNLHHEKYAIPLDAFTNGRTDLHGALKAVYSKLRSSKRDHERVKKIVLILTRGNHFSRRRCLTLAEKIKRKAEVFVLGFGSLPKSTHYVKWLASRPRRQHYIQLDVGQKYHFVATSIFERSCRKHCPRRRPLRIVHSCQRKTCRRLISLTTWHNDGPKNKCRRTVRTRSVTCCCLGKNSNRLVCRDGHLYRVIVDHSFDDKNNTCKRRTHQIDVSASIYWRCRPAKRRLRGVCEPDGWRRIVLVTRHVTKACQCRVKRRRLRRVRCRCPPMRRWKQCRQDHYGRWFKVYCHLWFRLSRYAHDGCAARRRCRRRQIVCKGQGRRSFSGRCRRNSCRRRRGIVWHSMDQCRCRRRIKIWSEICCCKQRTRRYKYCDRHRHSRVHHSRVHVVQRYRLVGGACRKFVRRIASPVPCPTRRSRFVYGKYCQANGLGFYRRVKLVIWRLNDCQCRRIVLPHGWQLCRCKRWVKRSRQCHPDSGIVSTTSRWLARIKNHCLWRSRVTSRVAITCSARRRISVGHCGSVTNDEHHGKKFRPVTVRWERRFGCKCRTITRHHTRLCDCPSRVRRVRHCQRDRWVKVSVFHYRLKRHEDGDLSCRLVHRSRHHRVRCRSPVIAYGRKCHNGKRSVKVTVFRPHRCHCVAKVYRHISACKAGCSDLMPSKICQKWARSPRVKLCHRHHNRHIAGKVCAKTCGRCCKQTGLVYFGEHCQKHYHQRHELNSQKTTFEACRSACHENHLCRAFNYRLHKHQCQLLRQPPSEQQHSQETPGCLLFVKQCATKRRSNCPFRRIVKSGHCKCRRVFGKSRRPLCYRKALVAVYHRHTGHSHGCERRLKKILLPCRWCDDSRSWCHRLTSHKCSKRFAKNRRLCPHSCRVCKRHQHHPERRSSLGACSKSGWRRHAVGGLWYDAELHLWRVFVRVKKDRCVACPVGTRLTVGHCTSSGTRTLTWLVVTFRGGHCNVKRHPREVKCCGGFDVNYSVGSCHRLPGGNGHRRKVTTRFTVHHGDRCIVKTHRNWFGCSPKCPRRSVTTGSCRWGKQIVYTRYFVTYPGSGQGDRCVPKEFTSTQKCAGSQGDSCLDKLSHADCTAVKRKGICASLQALCSKTCGKCGN